MNIEEARELCKEEFMKNVMANLDSTLIFTYISNLEKENQQLKKENKILRENAEHNDKVVDKVNWENQSLKKQLEEKENITCNWKDSCLENVGKIEILENQQKEFIKYLVHKIKLNGGDVGIEPCYDEIIDPECRVRTKLIPTLTDSIPPKEKLMTEILQKYIEIIGVNK